MEERTRKLAIPTLDVRRALGTGLGPRDPTTSMERRALWRATRTPDGAATYRVAWTADEAVMTAWGPGAEHVLARMPALLGLEDDPATFAPQHPLLAELSRRHPGLRLGRGQRLAEVLVGVILGQRVTTGEAHSAYRRLVFRFSERAPGPQRLWLPPAPERLRQLRAFELQGDDLDAKRAATIIRACVHYRKLDARQDAPAAEVCSFLQKLPGVGPWTANNALAVSHGWADAVPVGDFHIPHLVTFALAGEERGTDARMLELLAPFAPHRGRVIRLLMRSGMAAPRRGAKQAAWGFVVDRATRRHGGR